MSKVSVRESFGLRFSLLARRWRRALETHLAYQGLTDATWVPLVHLRATGGGITQKDLAHRVGVDSSSLVRVLDILEREGLVVRRRDESDGRARLISLTTEGEAREASIRTALQEVERLIMAEVSDADLTSALALFTRLDDGLNAFEANHPEAGQ